MLRKPVDLELEPPHELINDPVVLPQYPPLELLEPNDLGARLLLGFTQDAVGVARRRLQALEHRLGRQAAAARAHYTHRRVGALLHSALEVPQTAAHAADTRRVAVLPVLRGDVGIS